MIKKYNKLINIMRKTLDFQIDAEDCKGSKSFEFAGVDRCRYSFHGRIPQCHYFKYNTYNPSISVCEYQINKWKHLLNY